MRRSNQEMHHILLQRSPKYLSLGNALLPQSGQLSYVCPPLSLLPQVLHRIQQDRAWVILITPCWPRQFWFPICLCMSSLLPIVLPMFPRLLTQWNGKIKHPDPHSLHLRDWYLDGHPSQNVHAPQPSETTLLIVERTLLKDVTYLNGGVFLLEHIKEALSQKLQIYLSSRTISSL